MKMQKVACYLSGIVLVATLTACDKNQQATAPASTSANQAIAQSAGTSTENPSALRGKVTETMNAGGYTYIRINNRSRGELWAAIPKTQLKLGETVTLQGGSEMRNFSSKSLNRTFESIIFAGGVIRGDGSNSQATSTFSASGRKASNIVPFADLKIEKARVANAQTVGDVFRKTVELDTQKVTIKGKVVKISRNIMGKNWLHLQDGTGNQNENTHDLVITTSETVKKGAIITIEGTISANKDFGSGYKYDVIMEGAKVVAP